MKKLLYEFKKYEECLDHLATLYMKYSSILYETFRKNFFKNQLKEDLEDQQAEILNKILICCKDLQTHVLNILRLLEEQTILDLEEINKLNRIHVSSIGSYRYCILKANEFKENSTIQETAKILKACKDRLQHNIECYNNFLVENYYSSLLLTPNEAIKTSVEEEKDILKNL